MKIESLQHFYHVMHSTINIRKNIVRKYLSGSTISGTLKDDLQDALNSLESIPVIDGQKCLELYHGKKIRLELDYEINELKKDLFFLEHSEKEFMEYLADIHPCFLEQVKAAEDKLSLNRFRTFITDRDGTVNNYCGRYSSSVQSVYNAVFLARFAQNATDNSVVLTSAPLADIGLADISVTPENIFIYAGSKGREYFDRQGQRRGFPVSQEKQEKLNALNIRLKEILALPEYEKFTLIGSGLQYKFGQTTIARQDISGSIPENESIEFLEKVQKIMREIDPDSEYFRIEDTGKDIEIILTVRSENGSGELKDFDKGDGVRFLAQDLSLELEKGSVLICGDTGSDLPMVPAVMDKCPHTEVIFVTRDPELKAKVRTVFTKAIFVDEPDVLITVLNNLGRA